MLSFSGAFVCYAMGLVQQILIWPASLVVNVILTGIFYGTAAYLFACGITEQEQRRLPKWPALAVLATMLVLRTWGAYEPDGFLLRTGSLYGAVTILFLMAVWQIRHLRRGSALEQVLFWFVCLGTLTQLPRVLLTGNARIAHYGYDGELYWVGTQISFYLFSVGTALLFLLHTALRTIRIHLHAAESDSLTGIANRAGLSRFLRERKGMDERYGLVMLDADRFKAINDRYGHTGGDAVLREFARVLAQQIRRVDLVCRFGGEEFMVVLPGATLDETRMAAERLRMAIAGHDFSAVVPGMRCTVSIGIGSFSTDIPFESAYAQVDLGLAHAKRLGRNRIETFAGSGTEI